MKNKNFFVCENCKEKVFYKALGTHHRNHCPNCLWSKHVDDKPGDRIRSCNGPMKPIAISFKDEGVDKYGRIIQGEIVIIHRCQECAKETKNRLAGDDDPQKVIELCDKSNLTQEEKKEVETQLFGKKDTARW